MTTLSTKLAALLARRGLDYIDEFDDYMTTLTSAQNGVGAALVATSTTSATIGTGSKSLTVQADKNFAAGQIVIAYQTSVTTNYMIGTVTAYNGDTGVLAFTVASGDTNGSGTITDWTVAISGPRGEQGLAGDVDGPGIAGSTDNAWPRWNGVDGNVLQDGDWIEDDDGNVTAGGTLDMSGNNLTVDLVTVEAAGENAEGNATNVTGEVTLQATGAPVLRNTLTGDVTYLVAGAPTPGKGWQVEVRPTQDGVGGRNVTILPVNQLTYSADLQSTAEAGESRPWVDTNTSLSLNAAVGPDGQTTLTKLIEDAGGATLHLRTHSLAGLSPNQLLTLSVIVRDAGDNRGIRLEMYDSDSAGNSIGVYFNPTAGTTASAYANGNGVNTSQTVTALANSCYRVDLYGQPNTAGTNVAFNLLLLETAAGTQGTYAGDGTSGVYIGEIQVNKGSPVGIAHVGATRAGMVTWRNAADEIDFAAQSASTASRILISYGSDGEILVDDVSLVA